MDLPRFSNPPPPPPPNTAAGHEPYFFEARCMWAIKPRQTLFSWSRFPPPSCCLLNTDSPVKLVFPDPQHRAKSNFRGWNVDWKNGTVAGSVRRLQFPHPLHHFHRAVSSSPVAFRVMFKLENKSCLLWFNINCKRLSPPPFLFPVCFAFLLCPVLFFCQQVGLDEFLKFQFRRIFTFPPFQNLEEPLNHFVQVCLSRWMYFYGSLFLRTWLYFDAAASDLLWYFSYSFVYAMLFRVMFSTALVDRSLLGLEGFMVCKCFK